MNGLNLMESLKWMKKLDLEHFFLVMILNFNAILWKIRLKELGHLHFLMDFLDLLANGIKIFL